MRTCTPVAATNHRHTCTAPQAATVRAMSAEAKRLLLHRTLEQKRRLRKRKLRSILRKGRLLRGLGASTKKKDEAAMPPLGWEQHRDSTSGLAGP